ncbi:MAG: hypothetical protein ACFB0B_20555 [Thermonemataceae bacterium]
MIYSLYARNIHYIAGSFLRNIFMPQLTNNIDKLLVVARQEIEAFKIPSEERVLVYYSFFPALVGMPFKIIVTENIHNGIRSRLRQWDSAYKLSNWHLGIYRLDNLRIITEAQTLSTSDTKVLLKELERLQAMPLPDVLPKANGIVLDGVQCTLGIYYQKLQVDYLWEMSNPAA